jgi:hypothetical protein
MVPILTYASVPARFAFQRRRQLCKVSSGGASTMSVMFVGAIIALIVLVTALGGSRLSQRWAIGMFSMVAAALLAIGFFYFVK